MSSKPNILILTDWFVPGYKAGGPIKSIANLVQLMSDSYEFWVVTSNHDLDGVPFESVASDQWIHWNGAHVYYASTQSTNAAINSIEAKTPIAKVYLNSFFSLHFSIIPLLRARFGLGSLSLKLFVLAPRGMLGEGALKLKSTKKKVFIFLFKLLRIHEKITFHSTADSETLDIRKRLGTSAKIFEATNIPSAVLGDQKQRSERGNCLLFASRIAQKKNLDFLLKQLGAISETFQLKVVGPADEKDYLEKCLFIDCAPSQMNYSGAVRPDELVEEFRRADFYVLPTMNENFGHTIIESLSVGCPVIISDQTPWVDLETHGAGWVIPLGDENRWKQVLTGLVDITQEDYEKMSIAAKKYVSDKFNFEAIRDDYHRLFK